jgi:hypothetical protein
MLGVLALRDAKGNYADASGTVDPTPWRSDLRTADDAVARNDVHAAARALQAGYGAALGSRAWDGMLEVADAYLRIGDVIPAWAMARTRARAIYLTALFRARQQNSLDGVLACVEAFAALGDRDVVGQGLRIAEALATDPLARERIDQRRDLLAGSRVARMGAS